MNVKLKMVAKHYTSIETYKGVGEPEDVIYSSTLSINELPEIKRTLGEHNISLQLLSTGAEILSMEICEVWDKWGVNIDWDNQTLYVEYRFQGLKIALQTSEGHKEVFERGKDV